VSDVKLTIKAWSAKKLAAITVNGGTAETLTTADVAKEREIDFKITAGTTITITTTMYCICTVMELVGA
jgi:hypothetical protein